MARFSGVVGYANGTVETTPGVWVEAITERLYFGDVVKDTRKLNDSDKVNPDISVRNSISIVADEFANGHFYAIRYVAWSGALWTVTDVEVESPRLVLRLGGVYNGPTA